MLKYGVRDRNRATIVSSAYSPASRPRHSTSLGEQGDSMLLPFPNRPLFFAKVADYILRAHSA